MGLQSEGITARLFYPYGCPLKNFTQVCDIYMGGWMDGWGERERGISRLSSLPRIALLGEDESCILSAPSEREYSVLCYKCTVWERRPSVALPMQNLTETQSCYMQGTVVRNRLRIRSVIYCIPKDGLQPRGLPWEREDAMLYSLSTVWEQVQCSILWVLPKRGQFLCYLRTIWNRSHRD